MIRRAQGHCAQGSSEAGILLPVGEAKTINMSLIDDIEFRESVLD
jgi:hypothetical protein